MLFFSNNKILFEKILSQEFSIKFEISILMKQLSIDDMEINIFL